VKGETGGAMAPHRSSPDPGPPPLDLAWWDDPAGRRENVGQDADSSARRQPCVRVRGITVL